MSVAIEIELPEGIADLKLPEGVSRRLQELLDRQDEGNPLSKGEREEAEGLVTLSETLSLLRSQARKTNGDFGEPEEGSLAKSIRSLKGVIPLPAHPVSVEEMDRAVQEEAMRRIAEPS